MPKTWMWNWSDYMSTMSRRPAGALGWALQEAEQQSGVIAHKCGGRPDSGTAWTRQFASALSHFRGIRCGWIMSTGKMAHEVLCRHLAFLGRLQTASYMPTLRNASLCALRLPLNSRQ